MTLIAQQVQQIFEVVKPHIPYYDLQVEMVDHLACNIEAQLEETPVSFEQALQSAFARFGSSGFRLLIRKRRQTLVKQKWNAWFQSLLQQFTTYRFLFTILVFGIAAYAAIFWEKEMTQAIGLFVILSYFVVSSSFQYFIGKKEKQKMLLTETFRASLFGFVFPQLFFWLAIGPLLDAAFPIGFAVAATGFFLMGKATLMVNKDALHKAQQLYPEAFVKA